MILDENVREAKESFVLQDVAPNMPASGLLSLSLPDTSLSSLDRLRKFDKLVKPNYNTSSELSPIANHTVGFNDSTTAQPGAEPARTPEVGQCLPFICSMATLSCEGYTVLSASGAVPPSIQRRRMKVWLG